MSVTQSTLILHERRSEFWAHSLLFINQAAWPIGENAGLAIRRPRVQILSVRPVWILNSVKFDLNYLFQVFYFM